MTPVMNSPFSLSSMWRFTSSTLSSTSVVATSKATTGQRLKPIEVGQVGGVGFIRPPQPQRLNLLPELLLRMLRLRLDARADAIADKSVEPVRGPRVLPDHVSRARAQRVQAAEDQRVDIAGRRRPTGGPACRSGRLVGRRRPRPQPERGPESLPKGQSLETFPGVDADVPGRRRGARLGDLRLSRRNSRF